MNLGFETAQLLARKAKFLHDLTFGLTLQPDRSWLNELAPWNIQAMLVTLLVYQVSPMGWLKAEASYSSASRDEWPCPVSVETSRGYIQWRGGNAAGATGGQKHLRRTYTP